MTTTTTETTTQTQLPLQRFYDAELLEVPDSARRILEEYSKIPPEEVLPHILEVRNRAWKICPAPNIGHFRFLNVSINRSPAYKEIISRLKRGQLLLDVGCGFGQELRQLATDGVPTEPLMGIDINPDFFDFGNDLFRDASSFNGLFRRADILSHDHLLEQLKHKADIIWAGGLISQLDWNAQVVAMRHMLKLLRPHPDSLVVGWIIGNEKPGVDELNQKTVYRHSPKSFKKLFHEAADQLDEKWEVDITSRPLQEADDDVKISKGRDTVLDGALHISFLANKLARLDQAMYPKDASMNMDF